MDATSPTDHLVPKSYHSPERRKYVSEVRKKWRSDYESRTPGRITASQLDLLQKLNRIHEEEGVPNIMSAPIGSFAGRKKKEDISTFFAENLPPSNLVEVREILESALKENVGKRRVALVTSGGTPVPLERATVRFIDNFSTGTRGARCAEELLKEGYLVIFLHRAGSAFPFLTDISNCMRKDPKSLYHRSEMLDCPVGRSVMKRLVAISFSNLFEYLFFLRDACRSLSVVGSRCLIVLAAAVADFYVPQSEMSDHKIQSRASNGLDLKLSSTPKMLGCIKDMWGAKSAVVVSFKLETNPNILFAKAAMSILKYRVDAVVANVLDTRYEIAHIVRPAGRLENLVVEKTVICGGETTQVLVKGATIRDVRRGPDRNIEAPLIRGLVGIHSELSSHPHVGRRRRSHRTLVWGGCAAFAALVAVSNVLNRRG